MVHVKLMVHMGPGSRNLRIPHKGVTPLGGGICKNFYIHLDGPDRDSSSKEAKVQSLLQQ